MATDRGNDRKTLAGLSKDSSIPARTIRYYIARGLLPPPAMGGRGAYYTREHSERLERIRALQARGLTLAQIAWQVSAKRSEAELPQASAWWNYAVAEDVVVLVRSQMRPWRLKQVRALINQMASQLKAAEGEEENHAR